MMADLDDIEADLDTLDSLNTEPSAQVLRAIHTEMEIREQQIKQQALLHRNRCKDQALTSELASLLNEYDALNVRKASVEERQRGVSVERGEALGRAKRCLDHQAEAEVTNALHTALRTATNNVCFAMNNRDGFVVNKDNSDVIIFDVNDSQQIWKAIEETLQ